MENWLFYCGCAFICAFIISLLATPACKLLAWQTGFLDTPAAEVHKGHKKATPLLGGLAMCTAFCSTIILGLIVAFRWHGEPVATYMNGLRESFPELLAVVAGAIASMVWGAIDDKKPMKALTKFLGQLFIAAFVVIVGGIRITCFIDNVFVTSAITIFWFLFMFNALNFFDNMDGLAAGTAAIALVFFGVVSLVNHQYFVALLCFSAAASACGFWVYNAAPASIFMGDSGSHFLAFLLSVISAKVTYYNPTIASTRFAILIPIFILAVPIFDAFAVVVIRLKNHKPIYKGDHNHISHRFWHSGMTRVRAVQLVHLLVLVSSLGALPLLWGEWRTCLVILIQGIAFLLLLSVMQYAGIRANSKNLNPPE